MFYSLDILEIYLEPCHAFLFTKICYFKQLIFTDTVVLHTSPSMCKEYKGVTTYRNGPERTYENTETDFCGYPNGL